MAKKELTVKLTGDPTANGCVDAVELRIHERDSDLPTLHDVRAFGGWDTGGLTAVEFVRAIREDDDAA